ncbi:MAG TPA: TonB-system energizer ExbB [Syntrophaceae bacterium]|nr:TonB-system energizer ExbB [Syntrophaceae bacterium]HCX01462.1 TonB-system energizer ExbB [Syntrophaceae bacterium]
MAYLGLIIDYGVIGLLVLMSVAALSIVIERCLTYGKIRLEQFTDKRLLEHELTRGLHLIATIGSNAPYIGLLGTVLGIMFTFYTMGTEGFLDTGKIMIGLSMALKATAAGLVVAIPSIVFYNLLLRKVKGILLRWEVEHER